MFEVHAGSGRRVANGPGSQDRDKTARGDFFPLSKYADIHFMRVGRFEEVN